MPVITASRYHDFSYGHRVCNHESKCAHLHGHNGRVHFTLAAEHGRDDIGRVLDFSAIKSRLCQWLEDNWDHKFLAYENDPIMLAMHKSCNESSGPDRQILNQSLVWVPFNPTAENMAEYLCLVIGPKQLLGTGCYLSEVRIEETTKCHAGFHL